MRPLILFATLVGSAPVLAAGETDSVPVTLPSGPGTGAVLEMLLGLVAVIGLILLLAWAARRINVLPGQRAGMQVVAVLPLGQRERAVLVQVGEQQLLLGVSAQQVTLLQRFEQPVLEPKRAPEGAFSARLQEMIRQRGGKG